MRPACILSAFAAALAASGVFADVPFSRAGQVAHVYGGRPQRFTILKEIREEGVCYDLVTFWIEDPKSHPKFDSGDMVRLSGVSVKPWGPIAEEFPNSLANMVTNLEVVAREPLPASAKADGKEINSGERNKTFVRVSGVVSSVIRDEMNAQWNWFILRTATGNVYVAATENEHPLEGLLALTDSESEVSGLVLPQSLWRRFSGQYVIPTGKDSIRTISAAKPPGEAPRLEDQAIAADTFAVRERRGDFLHRVRTEGAVIAINERFAFMQTESGPIVKLALLSGSPRPSFGARVSATGFVALDFNGLQMHDTVLTPAPGDPLKALPAADSVPLAKLYRETKINNRFVRKRSTTTGRVANSIDNIRSSGIITIESDGLSADVDVSAMPEKALDGVTAGATIRVTGVCNAEFETNPSASTFPRFAGFTIVPDCENGITVVVRPPWWTTGRLMAVIVSLLCALAAISGLCVVLKKLSDRRGRQLYEERVAHVRTETKVEERTRLAVELHDAVSQTLTGVALQVDAATRANGDGNPRVGAFLTTVRQMLASCRRELQDCLWDLRTRTFDEKDMTEAITKTIGPHVEGIDIAVRFNVPRERLSESTTHSILSIVRELAINAIKHGKATRIRVAGEYHDGTVTFSVRDNGCGFDPASAPGPREGHFGMRGIRERIHAHKGTMEVSSAPGKGTKITVSMQE